MREPKLQKRPEYRLLKQSDAVTFFHMQMPRWLFCDPKYTPLSLEAKVAYTFLLNRFQLSKMNGWINSDGEVFIIFPREKLAEEMGVSYRKAISCFKELLGAGLIWERRVGRGNANRVYLAAVTLSGDSAAAHDSAPFAPSREKEPDSAEENAGAETDARDAGGSRSAGTAGQAENETTSSQGNGPIAPRQDLPYPQGKGCQTGTSGPAESAPPDLPFRHPSKKELRDIDLSDMERVSPSRHAGARESPRGQADRDGAEDMRILSEILDSCELDVLPEEEAGVFRNAVTRLYFLESFKTGGAVLPGAVVRSQLRGLDGITLLDTREKLRNNTDKQVKNSTAYVMAALFNNIWETRSDLMVDPYLNSLGTG